MSHSGEIAVFAFAIGRKVGVDVEYIRYDVDVEEIPPRFFSRMEQQTLGDLRGQPKFEGFFNCWTRKEAYVKAVGSGLSLPLRDFDVSLVPGEPRNCWPRVRLPNWQPNGAWSLLNWGPDMQRH